MYGNLDCDCWSRGLRWNIGWTQFPLLLWFAQTFKQTCQGLIIVRGFYFCWTFAGLMQFLFWTILQKVNWLEPFLNILYIFNLHVQPHAETDCGFRDWAIWTKQWRVTTCFPTQIETYRMIYLHTKVQMMKMKKMMMSQTVNLFLHGPGA